MKLITKTLALAMTLSLTASFGQSEYCIYQVEDFYPGPTGSNGYQYTEYNGEIYFSAADPSAGFELLKFDGNSISLVQDIRPGALSSQPNRLTVYNGDLYFAAHDGTNGTELYKYDGTTATLAADINPGIFHSYPDNLIVMGGNLYFTADDGTSGNELWKFDGTNATMVADIFPGPGPSLPLKFHVHADKLYFQAMNATDGRELYEYDGTTLNTWDLNPGSGDSNPSFFYTWGSELVFSADNGASGMELWEFNLGSPVMTEIAGGGPNGNPTQFVTYQGDLYFRASNLTYGAELYKYDGSTVTNVADIMVGNFHSNPDNITSFGTEILFTANDGTSGYELWKWDGTSASMVQSIAAGSADAFSAFNAIPFQVAGTKIFMLADNGTNGKEWWAYDGVSCVLAKDLNPGSADASITEPAVFGTDIYFTATNGSDGEEMHHIDATAVLTDSIIVATCGSYVSPGGQSFSGNGTYQVTDIIPSVACPGCDSLLYIDLTITDDTLEIEYDVINCGTWFSPMGVPYSTVGQYTVVETYNSVVCPGTDSVITVNLEIVQLSNAVTTFGSLLIAQASGAQYQWLDCDNGMAFIPGATAQDFNPPVSGNYAVQLSLGGCVDTSACNSVTVVDPPDYIEENDLDAYVHIFPIPATDQITVQTDFGGNYTMRLMEYSGRVIEQVQATSDKTTIGLEGLANGMYLIEVTNENGRAVKKFLKQ